MRPIHLFAVLVLALAGIFSLWFATQRGRGVVHASNASADEDPSLEASVDLASGAHKPVEEKETRVAIHYGPSAEQQAQAEAEKKKNAARRVEGRVVDKLGAGVVNATVWATTSSNWIQFP